MNSRRFILFQSASEEVEPPSRRLVRRVVKAALAAPSSRLGHRPRAFTLAVRFLDDEEMCTLNAQFRGIEKTTNVLSFPSPRSDGSHGPRRDHLGDIAVSLPCLAREARAQGKMEDDHLAHLLTHGVLHLLGYDHECDREAEEMEGQERQILAELGVADPYQEHER